MFQIQVPSCVNPAKALSSHVRRCATHLPSSCKQKSIGDQVSNYASIVNPYYNQHLIATLQLGAFSEEDIENAFNRIDVNLDGKICARELYTVFQKWGEKMSLSEQELNNMVEIFIKKWGDDNSGGISKQEFKRHALELGNQVHPVIYQLSACVFLLCVPFGIIVPFEPQLVSNLGITAAHFGIAQAAFPFTKFLVNIPITDVVDRFGSKPIMVGCTALLGLSLGSLSLVDCLEHLILCRAIGGFAAAGLFASIQSPAVAVQTPLNRVRSGAPFTQAMNAGIALGPAIGGLLSGFISMETTFVGVGVMFLLAAAANHRIYTEIAPPKGSNNNNPFELFSAAFGAWSSVLSQSKDVRILCGVQTVLYAAVGGTNMTLLPLLLVADPLLFTSPAIGALSAGVATLGVVIVKPLAVFADKFGRRTALGLGSIIMSGSMAMVPLMGTPALVSGAVACTAVGQNLLAPSVSALVIDSVSKVNPQQVTQAMSLMRSVTDIGVLSGAAFIGAVGSEYGFVAGYELSSGAVLCMSIAAFLRLPTPPSPAKA